jgi:hypothetical protein
MTALLEVLELHTSGLPTVHIVMNTHWMCIKWNWHLISMDVSIPIFKLQQLYHAIISLKKWRMHCLKYFSLGYTTYSYAEITLFSENILSKLVCKVTVQR